MARAVPKFLDVDCYTEAKRRINEIIDTHDDLTIGFSGGKDSLATLHLVKEVYAERGITRKINIHFKDEEFYPEDVINLLKQYHDSGEYNFDWIALPVTAQMCYLGNRSKLVLFDPNRKWARQPPPYALTDTSGKIYDKYTMNDIICRNIRGKVALLTGQRCAESIFRLRSVLNKINQPYITHTDNPRVSMCKPIYDWQERDVFLYFLKAGIKYSPIYDAQMYSKEMLRVATPFIAEGADRFHLIKTRDPDFWARIIDIFPEMETQARYNNSLAKADVEDLPYERTEEGLLQFVKDTTDKSMRDFAVKMIQSVLITRRRKIALGATDLGGYPLRYLFAKVAHGAIKRHITPQKPNAKDYAFEGIAYCGVHDDGNS